MTLKDLLLKKREEAKFWTKSEDLELDPQQLETIIWELKQCDEFIDCDLRILSSPAGGGIDAESGLQLVSKTFNLFEGTNFGKRGYLYKIHIISGFIQIRGHFDYYSVPNQAERVKI